MTDIGELVVRIKADAAQLDREMKKASGIVQGESQKMNTSLGVARTAFMALIPAVAISAMVSYGEQAVDLAGHMNDLSQQTDVASGTIAALEGTLNASGASIDQFAASINLMNANVGSAVSGNDELAKKFERLGLSIDSLKKLSAEQQFYAIADALARVDTQYEQTEIGRAIFGRGFAALIPLIKEANGNLSKTVEHLKDTGNALNSEQIERIDEFGDALEDAGLRARNAFLQALAAILKVTDEARIRDETEFNPGAKYSLDRWGRKLPVQGPSMVRGTLSTERPDTVSEITFLNNPKKTTGGIEDQANATKRLSDAQQEANRIFDETRTAQEVYNTNIAQADELLQKNLITQDTYNRYIEEQAAILSKDVPDGFKKTEDAGVQTMRVLKDYTADALDAAIMDFENFGDAATRILKGVASDIFRLNISQPFSDSLSGLFNLGGGSGGRQVGQAYSGSGYSGSYSGGSMFSGIGDWFGGLFADGGSPPVGKASVVGEQGPELFVPNTAGTIVPNHALGGSQVTVQQTIVVNAGVSEEVSRQVAAAAPVIKNSAIAGVFDAIQRGGAASKLVGKRA